MAEKSTPTKRQVPKTVQMLLNIDRVVTKQFCNAVNVFLPYKIYRQKYKFIEYTCHAIPWFAVTIGTLWLLWDKELFQTQINILLGLAIDCFVVAVTKAVVRRRRPTGNADDMFMTIGVDVYSFPSGHTSRAVMIAYIFAFIAKQHCILVTLIAAWSISVCLSRVLLRRHHLLDVFGGVIIGLLEGLLLSMIWLNKSTSYWLVQYLSDENVDLEGLQDDADFID